MNKIIYAVSLLLIATVVYADQIFLSDGTSVKGTVIQVTDREIEYDPEGDRAFDVVDRSSVTKIVYADGRVVSYQTDRLYRDDGTYVRGTVIRVTKDEITYLPEGETNQATVPRETMSHIEYSDGKVVYITKKQEADGESAVEQFEEKVQTGGFIDSWVRIAGFGSFGGPSKGLFDRERRVFRAYKADLIRAYVIPRDYQFTNIYGSGGGEVDLLLPAIKFKQKRGFDFTGIKFGVRGRYGFTFVESLIVNDDSYFRSTEGDELIRAKLLSYHHWAVGPVMNLVFSPRNNVFNFILNFYAVGGQIFDGHLRAAAALRSSRWLAAEMYGVFGPPFLPRELANVTNSVYFNKTRFSGYTIRCGFGPHVTLNRYVPIMLGLNITYAYSNISLGRALPIYYDGNKRAAHHEVGAEISVGFHVL
ncbi:MAG: hypothetical protein JW807_08930 [Spirochaetes bacterium]|nr:hypothetical protein [Spirochaetota bacterium]